MRCNSSPPSHAKELHISSQKGLSKCQESFAKMMMNDLRQTCSVEFREFLEIRASLAFRPQEALPEGAFVRHLRRSV